MSAAPTGPLSERLVEVVRADRSRLSAAATALAEKVIASGRESLSSNELATYEAELLPRLREAAVRGG